MIEAVAEAMEPAGFEAIEVPAGGKRMNKLLRETTRTSILLFSRVWPMATVWRCFSAAGHCAGIIEPFARDPADRALLPILEATHEPAVNHNPGAEAVAEGFLLME